MSYRSFKNIIADFFGDFYSYQVVIFFEEAVQLAEKGDFTSTIKIGKDALALTKFTKPGYENLYLIGMLCQAYLDNEQPKMANKYFKRGMYMIDKNDEDYMDDVNAFLDLKILINEELNKS
jgi:hypothetical protein